MVGGIMLQYSMLKTQPYNSFVSHNYLNKKLKDSLFHFKPGAYLNNNIFNI